MGRLLFWEGILGVQQVWEGQGPVSGGIFNRQTLAWQKLEGMALAASVALRESERKERSQGEQREKITRQRAVRREEAFTVRREEAFTVRREEAFTVREKQVPLGMPWGKGEENLSPSSGEMVFFGPKMASHSCKAGPSALNIPATRSFLPK